MDRILTIATLMLTLVSTGAFAKTLQCVHDDDTKGWIPSHFTLEMSEDRSEVTPSGTSVEPFHVTFEKGAFGNDYHANSKGETTGKEQYYFQYQLSLDKNDTEFSIYMRSQGYRDLFASGTCEESDEAIVLAPGFFHADTGSGLSASKEKSLIILYISPSDKRASRIFEEATDIEELQIEVTRKSFNKKIERLTIVDPKFTNKLVNGFPAVGISVSSSDYKKLKSLVTHNPWNVTVYTDAGEVTREFRR